MTSYEEQKQILADLAKATIEKIKQAPECIDIIGKLYVKCPLVGCGDIRQFDQLCIQISYPLKSHPMAESTRQQQITWRSQIAEEIMQKYKMWLPQNARNEGDRNRCKDNIEIDGAIYRPWENIEVKVTDLNHPVVAYLVKEVSELKAQVEALKNK